jgi:AraC family transcriptional regulator
MSSAVDSAIARIWEDYSEPLSLADIAKSAILSRFHFSRVFRNATGVSPGRFLSAVRIYQAKRLLASTSLSVTDISLAVGYNSLGSFTNRFTDSVGASPSRFRRMCRDGIRPVVAPVGAPARQYGAITGALSLPAGYETARVYTGIFDTPIVQRRPVASIIIDAGNGQPAGYRLPNVPAGEWYVRAVAAADSADPEPWTRRALLVGGQGPVTVSAAATTIIDVALHPRSRSDLPILFAVPDLEPRIIAPTDDAGYLPEAELLLPATFATAAGH